MKMMGRVHYRLSGLWTYTTHWDITRILELFAFEARKHH